MELFVKCLGSLRSKTHIAIGTVQEVSNVVFRISPHSVIYSHSVHRQLNSLG